MTQPDVHLVVAGRGQFVVYTFDGDPIGSVLHKGGGWYIGLHNGWRSRSYRSADEAMWAVNNHEVGIPER